MSLGFFANQSMVMRYIVRQSYHHVKLLSLFNWKGKWDIAPSESDHSQPKLTMWALEVQDVHLVMLYNAAIH